MSKREEPHPPTESAAALTTTPSTAGSMASVSISPQSSVSQSQAVKGASTSTAKPFPAGAEVEVKISAEGFYDSWYEATVVSHRFSLGSRGGVRYKVRYLEFLRDDGSGEKLVEHVSAKDVRPRPPRRISEAGNEDEDPKFKMYDLVEAYLNDGWWHGVISGLRDPETGLYTVSFPNSREVFRFKPAEIRPKLVFVNGNWVSVLDEEQIGGNFKEGDKVEVHHLQDKIQSYFPAKIEKVIHNSYYLVKYDSPCARPKGDLTEILEPHYLRPAVDGIPETSCFTTGSHVEFFQNGCWSPGIVLSCLSGSDYEVTLGSKCKPMVVNVSNLRVRLDWDGQNWSKWSSPSKEKKRTSAHSSKSFTSDVALAEKDEITPNNVVSKGKKRPSAHSSKSFTSDVALADKGEITPNSVVSGGKKRTSAHSSKSFTSDVALAEKGEITPNSVISSGKKRTSADSSKSFTSDVALAEKSEITPNSVVSGGKKLKKESSEKGDEFQNPLQHKVTPSMDLEPEDGVPITQLFRVRPKLSKIDKSSGPKMMCAVRKVYYSRRLLTELKDCQSISKRKRSCTCKGNLNDCQINKKQDDVSHNRWITSEEQNNVLLSMESYSDVLQPDTSPLLPFKMTCPIWNTLKTFKVFNHIPQRPHFRMLESKSKEEREGLAIGMMVTYANLVESIQNLSIDSEATVLEEKIACLVSLKENGFIVNPISSHLHDLLAIKAEITNSELKRNELETELTNNEQENTASHAAAISCDTKLEDIRKELEEFRMRVAELESKEKSIIKEKEQVLSSAVNREQVMSKLREEICLIESSHALNLDKFERVRSRLFTKELL